MEGYRIIPGLLIVSLAFLSCCLAQDQCVKQGPCSCMFSNGTGIDLSPVVKPTFYTTKSFEEASAGSEYKFITYFYHPCFDITPSFNTTGANTTTCNVPLAICRHTTTLSLKNASYVKDLEIYEFMGNSIANFSNDGKSIIYFNNPSKSEVLLVCSEGESGIHVYDSTEPNDVKLVFYSPDACMKQLEEIGRSFGSTLLIILFSLVIFYLVLGVLTRKFLMGATGIEVIPNLASWTDLPNLVKDGFAFARNGFKLPARGSAPTISPDPNSYDSI